MNRATRTLTLVALSLALAMSLTACASFSNQSGFLDGYYKNLQPGPEGGAKERWMKPGVDFSKYDKVMLDGVVFYFAPDSEDKGIDPEQMKELSDAFNKELVSALKDKYPIVADPGPGVLRIKIALTGIKESRPVLSGITTIVPVGLVVSTARGMRNREETNFCNLYHVPPVTNISVGSGKTYEAKASSDSLTGIIGDSPDPIPYLSQIG